MNYYPTFFITGASLSEGKVSLSVSGRVALSNRSVARFLFAPGVAVPSEAEPSSQAVLRINGADYPLYGKFSQPMALSEIPAANGFFRTRTPIVCGIASSGDSFYLISWNLPRPTEFIVPL